MPAPTVATYSLVALTAAHEAFIALLDAGSTHAVIKVRDADDVLLGSVPLGAPCGAVSETTGQLTFDIAGRDESAAASGTAAYAEFCDSDDNVHLALPTVQGVAPVPGYLALNTLTILSGGPIEIFTATLG